jgi:hypothetical protein
MYIIVASHGIAAYSSTAYIEVLTNTVGDQEAVCNQNGLCGALYACLHLSYLCSHVRWRLHCALRYRRI